MPQVSTSTWVNSKYPSKVFSPPSRADSSLTLLAAKSTWVPQADRVVVENEENEEFHRAILTNYEDETV